MSAREEVQSQQFRMQFRTFIQRRRAHVSVLFIEALLPLRPSRQRETNICSVYLFIFTLYSFRLWILNVSYVAEIIYTLHRANLCVRNVTTCSIVTA